MFKYTIDYTNSMGKLVTHNYNARQEHKIKKDITDLTRLGIDYVALVKTENGYKTYKIKGGK